MGLKLKKIHQQILQKYLSGDGTIPTVLILGGEKEEIVRKIRESCSKNLVPVGSVTLEGIFIGADHIADHPGNDLAAVNSLLIDPSVAAVLLATEGCDFHLHGLPLPFFDSLFLANWQGAPEGLARMLLFLRPHLRGAVVLDPTSPHWQTATRIFGNSRVRPVSSLQAMVEALNQFLSTDQVP
jgi:hypothetical protein